MNRPSVLDLARQLRELMDAREEAAAKVMEIDAVLDDCRAALGATAATLTFELLNNAPAPVVAALPPVDKATLSKLCQCGCGDALPKRKTRAGGRPRRYLEGHRPSQQVLGAPVQAVARLGNVFGADKLVDAGLETVFTGRGFKDGRTLSSSMGHSSLHGAAARG